MGCMTIPLFFWLLALALDASLFLLLLRRSPSPMRWLIGYKIVASLILLLVRGDPFAPPSWNYVWAYAAYTYGLAGLICWTIQSLAHFEPLAVRFALLLSLLMAVGSIYCAPPMDLTVTLLRAADRLCWLAPTALILWGIFEPPAQVSRRESFTYSGFALWCSGELIRSFAKLAGLVTLKAAVLYPLAVTAWILAEMQLVPVMKKRPISVKLLCTENGLLTANDGRAYRMAKMRRK
jgi:hypothetical protein